MDDQKQYHEPLHTSPAPPEELHKLLRYLSDAMALYHWLLEPAGETAPADVETRIHLEAGGSGQAQLTHPDLDGASAECTETYVPGRQSAAELLHDVALCASVRTQARSQWQSWTVGPQHHEEIRIELSGAPGYWVQCPLDDERRAMHPVATLQLADEDEDPDGSRTHEVPINGFAAHLLGFLAASVDPATNLMRDAWQERNPHPEKEPADRKDAR